MSLNGFPDVMAVHVLMCEWQRCEHGRRASDSGEYLLEELQKGWAKIWKQTFRCAAGPILYDPVTAAGGMDLSTLQLKPSAGRERLQNYSAQTLLHDHLASQHTHGRLIRSEVALTTTVAIE